MAQVIQVQPQQDRHSYFVRVTKLLEEGELDKAFEALDEVLMKDPNDAQAMVLASEVLKKAKKLPIAYSMARRAADLKPERPETWNALGHAAQLLWRLDEAESSYRKALQRAMNAKQKVLYLNNICSVHLDAGQFKKAERPAREALALSNDDVSIRHNLGLSLLAQRRWKEAWPFYAASIGSHRRLNTKYMNPHEPTWDGSKDKRVVVYGEQGLGDEVCAASMLPDVIRDSAKVIIDCDHRLENLFRRSFPQATVYGTRWKKDLAWAPEDRKIDASIAGFEVAKFYRNSDAEFPGTPYLTPDPERVLMWKALFATKKKPVIGIAWTGGTWHNASVHRQLPLDQWKPIFDAVNAHWVSLQYKDASKDIVGTPVVQYPHATLTKDYDDTAALVAACDLVIGVQTSVHHLASAMGVPSWVMVPDVSQWRYGEDYTDIPFYKSMKLYRQHNGNWPIKSIANDLRAHFNQS
jgi:tetratricopeptide (TPR) repeat protein